MNEREEGAGLAPAPRYRYAEQVGDQLYVAGQVPMNSDGELVGIDDVRAQARQCLDNLLIVLDVNGLSLSDVRFVTIYVVGPHQTVLDGWDEVATWFGQKTGEIVPSATLLGVTLLGYGNQLIEIDVTVRKAADHPAH